MKRETVPESARRGRPRSEKARAAILSAATDLLLARGPSAVSMDAVAERAGVSKATIYRWWPTKETLALDALYHEWTAGQPPVGGTGTLRGDLLSLLQPWVCQIRDRPYGRIIAALVTEAHTDPEFAERYLAHFVEPRREPAREIFRQAIERGEIRPGTKVEVAIDLLYGPLYHRLLHGHAALDEGVAADVVDIVIAGLGAQPLQPAQPPQRAQPARSAGSPAAQGTR